MNGTKTRLAALERLYPAVMGCATCRTWPRVRTIVTHDEGNVIAPPTVCPDCGRQATRLTRVYVLVPSPEVDAA